MFTDCCRLSPRKLMLRWRSGSRKLLGSALLITFHGGISTPAFFPGESYGQRSLVGYSPWGHKDSDTTEWLGTGTWGKGGRRDEVEGQAGLSTSAELLVISDARMVLWSCSELVHSGQPCAPSPWIEAALERHMPFHETTLFHWGSFPERMTAEGSQPAALSAAGEINPSGLGHSMAHITLTIFINFWISCS